MTTASLTEQILEAVATKFSTVPGCTFTRSRQSALALIEGVSLNIQPEEEPVTKVGNRMVKREFTLVVRILGRGSVPDQVIDPVRVAAHAALMADTTLGGLCLEITEQSSEWEFEEADQTAAELKTRYKIFFATPTTTIASVA